MLFVSLQGPRGLTYVFIITQELPTLVPVDGLTISVQRLFIIGFD